MRVALTQGRGRLEGLDHDLEALGMEVVRAPLIETRPLLNDSVRRAARALARLPWLLFTSRSAVDAWQALELPLMGPRLGVTGPATAAALQRAGARVEVVGEPATAAGLADRFLSRLAAEPRSALGPVGLPQGNLALPTLRDRLEAAGLQVRSLVVYETVSLAWRGDAKVDAIVLASPSAVRALPLEVGRGATVITLGPSSSRAALARGFVPLEATPDATAVAALLGRRS